MGRGATFSGNQRRSFRTVAEAVKDHPARVVGFSLFWAWIWMIFQGSPSILPLLSSTSSSFCHPLLFYALGFVLLGVLYQVKRIVPHGIPYAVALALAMACGTAWMELSGSPALYAEVKDALRIGGCLLVGLGAACLHTEWARLFVTLGAQRTIVCSVLATLLATAAVLLLEASPTLVRFACLVLIPAACVAIVFRDPRQTARLHLQGCKTKVYLPWKLLVTAFVQGVSLGLMAAMAGIGLSANAFFASLAGYIVGAILIFGAVQRYRADYNVLIYKIGFPVMAAAWLVVLATGALAPFAVGIHAIGYRFVDLAIWSVTVYIIKQRELPTNWVCAVNTCALMGGQFVGTALASFQEGPLRVAHLESLLPAMIVFLLFMAALLVYSSKNLKTGWGLVRPSDDPGADEIDVASRALGNDCGLTKREAEVLALLARGRNRAYICEQLVLAQDTVKTYIRTIYRKLGVHSQQELISIVEAKVEEGQA